MNWIKQFNQTSKEIEQLVYDESIKIIMKVEEYYKLAYENLSEVTVIGTANNADITIEDIKDNIYKITIRSNIIEDLLACINEINLGFITRILDVLSRCIKMFTIKLYAMVNNNKEKMLCKKRLQLWLAKMQNQMLDLSNYLNEGLAQEFFDSSEELCMTVGEHLSNQFIKTFFNNVKENQNVDDIIDNKMLNIYDWKDMEELALNNNYKYKYSNGSHRIYEHSNTHKIIVIPSHNLGKGLSIKIQKQIYLNSTKIN